MNKRYNKRDYIHVYVMSAAGVVSALYVILSYFI